MKHMKRWMLPLLSLSILYWFTRLYHNTLLPVFADEAIYIRWAQMALSDFSQFGFRSLYDGKTPLFIWTLMPFLQLKPLDPLWVARFVSTLFGFGLLLIQGLLAQQLGAKRVGTFLTMLFSLLLPYNLFHERMGLIDTMLTFWLGLTLLFNLKTRQRQRISTAILSGACWGLAILTKLPAVFFGPILLLLLVPPIFWNHVHLKRLFDKGKKSPLMTESLFAWKDIKHVLLSLIVIGGIAMGMLLSLSISEFFPFLFSRSIDFTYSSQELLHGRLIEVLRNSSMIGRWWMIYIGAPILLSPLLTSWRKLKKPRIVLAYWGMGFLFALPFVVVGKVLASRYLLPSTLFFVPVFGLLIESVYLEKKWLKLYLWTSLFAIQAVYFAYPLLTNPQATPMAKEDREQYLFEWSSGYGIPEVRDFIRSQAREGKQIAVATEGYFGTLPDGLLMYFVNDPYFDQIEIYGVGQPIVNVNPETRALALKQPTYIVVNEHRQSLLQTGCCELIHSYRRPGNAPSLLLFKVIPKDEAIH